MNNNPDNSLRNDIRGLYDLVTEVGRQTKNPYPLSFQDFSRVMQKEENRRGLYDKLSKRAGIGGTYEDFEKAFFNPYASETNQVAALRSKTFTLDPRKEMARQRALMDASRGEYNPYGTSEVSYNPDRSQRGTEIAPIDLVDSEDTLPEIATSTGPKTTRTFWGGVVSGARGIKGGAEIAVADLLKGFGGNSDDEKEAIHLIDQMEQDGTLSLERVRGVREKLLKELDSYTHNDILFSGDYSKKARKADALKLIEERMQRMGQNLTPDKRAVALDAMRSDLSEKGASEDKENPFVRWKEGAKDYMRKSEVPEGTWAELGSATASVGGALAGQAISMIPGAAPVGQAISWASIGAQTISSGGQAIMDMEDYAAEKGVYISPEDKATISLGYMAAEFGGDALGGAVASKSISAIGKLAGGRIGQKLAVRSLAKGIAGNEGVRQSLSSMSEYAQKPLAIPLAKSAGRQIVRGAVTEGPGESLTTLAQNGALDRVWKDKEDQEAWADVARQAVKDGIYGAWAGALMGGFGAGIQSGQVARMHRKEGLTIVQDEKNNLYEVIGADKDQSAYLVLDRAGRQKMLPADQVVDAIHYTPEERQKAQKAYDEATEGLHPKEEVLTENQKRAGAILAATEQRQSPIYRATHPEVAEEELNSPVALSGAKQALADVLEGQNEEVRTRVDQMALVLKDGETDATEELTKLLSDESLSDNDRQSILDVVTAQSRLTAIERSHQEAMAQMQSELTKEWSAKSVVGDESARGAVISATITDADGKPKQVYVTGGVRVVTNENGTVELLPTDDNAPIYVYDESVEGDEKGHIVQMDDLSSPQLVAEDYLDLVQASLDEAETAFRSEVQAAEGQLSQEQAPQNTPEDAGDTTDDFMQSLPRTREGEVDGLKLMSERPDDFIRYLGQLYGDDFVASLPLSKNGALDLKALTPEQTLKVNEAALGKSGAVEAARQRRSKVGAERSKLEAEVKSDLGNLEKRMALRKASEEYRLYDDYVRTAEEQARQELEAKKRAEEAALTPEERQRREEEKRQLAQEKKEREERIRLENERRRREREELERNAEGSTVREYTEDPPRQARARGARLVNGAVVYRQEPMTVVHYADAERAFSQRPGETRVPVKRTIVEAESLQASHKEGQMNPRHFIPEAQPKDRADNGLSSTAADRIASDIRPDEITGGITAYTGAPVVNGRGEVIQGNNRTDALQTMYDGAERHAKSAERYKEYLKAHASEYGMTAEQVDAMAHPVAVDVAEVSDSEAIRLGHRGQTDLESAGADTMNAQTVGEELNSDTDPQSGQSMLVSFFNRIFNRTGANGAELSAKMDNMLNRNAEEGLKFLLGDGYITDTQYKNAFETNSEGKRVVTAEAKTALKDVALYQLADVIGPRAMDIFYRLPASARNGLATFLYRDSQASFETSLAPDLGDALLVWDSLRQDPDFAGLTNFESAKIFILGKVSLFGRSELETNLGEASSLAKLLAASMQTQTEEQIAGALNKYYDLVGANETGAKTQSLIPTSQPTDTKAGAAEAVYGRVYEVPSGREKHYRFRRDVAEDFRARRDALADRITEERRKYAAAMDMARTLGVPMKLHEDMSTLPEEVRAGFDETHSVKGWFYKGDNAVHIYLPANVDADDVRATFLHEAVGHYGCRELLGEVGYNQVLDGIASKLGEEEVLRAMKEYCDGSQDLADRVQVRIAMDEWVAHRAESGITKKTVWESIKDFFRKVFGLSGKQIDQSAEMMADDLLRRSAENLQKRAERQQGVATEVSPERTEVRFRSNRSAADFARLRDAAIEQKGLVAPGLNQSSVKVTHVERHSFTGTGLQAIEKAMVWAQGRIVKDHWYHKGMSDGFKYLIDDTSIEKYLSESSTTGSDNLGVHLATLKVLPRVINRSILAETHPDYGKVNGQRSADNGVNNPNMLVHRLYGAIDIDGQLYRVKTTLHERYNADDRAYDYMVTNMELVISGSSTSDALTSSTNKHTSTERLAVAKLLKGVEKSYESGKLLLDESENTGSEEETTRFRRAERAGDVSSAAEAVSDFMRNATPKNTSVDDVLRFSRVYHNSPHLLKKADGSFVDPETGERLGFDHRFMGSGEGAQAHGWGSYFSVKDLEEYATPSANVFNGMRVTQNEAYVISNGGSTHTAYLLFLTIRDCCMRSSSTLNEKTVKKAVKEDLERMIQEEELSTKREGRLLEALKDNEPWAVAAISPLQESTVTDQKTGYRYTAYSGYSVENVRGLYERARHEVDSYKEILAFTERNPDYVEHFASKIQRHKYVVEIPDPDTNHYIEEDRRLTKHEVEMIRDALNDNPEAKDSPLVDKLRRGCTGGEAYELLSLGLGEEQASRLLNKAGFVGIHYNGKYDGECYVIFNESDAKVTDHYRFRRQKAHLAGVHTLTTDNLRHALKMGGLANPSIAVFDTERGLPTRTFGEVALIAPRDLVDANTGRHKGTYNRDSWSPVYPRIAYDLTEKGHDLMRELDKKRGEREGSLYALHNLVMEEPKILDKDYFIKLLSVDQQIKELYRSEAPSIPFDQYVEKIAEPILKERQEMLYAGQNPDGSKRYVPHTLENVSKVMSEDFSKIAPWDLFMESLVDLSEKYKSLESIRRHEDRMAGMDDSLYKKVEREFHNLAEALVSDKPETMYPAEPAKKLQALIVNNDNRYGRPLTVTEEASVSALREQMKALPTDYFETKVDRPVGLDEFVEAVVPEGTSPELVSELEKSGLKVSTYDSTKDGAMNEAVLSAMDRADATDRGVRFRTGEQNIEEVNRTFNEELEKFLAGGLSGGHAFNLGLPGAILRATGIPALPIRITGYQITKKAKDIKHPFTPTILRNLPEALQSPVAVFTYGKNKDMRNIIVDIDYNGENILIGLVMNKRQSNLKINDIKGLFPKSTSNWLRWIADEKDLYLNSKKIQALVEARQTNPDSQPLLDLDLIAKVQERLEETKHRDEMIARAELQEGEIDGEKALDWLGIAPPKGASAQANPKLSDIANIINGFENPKVDRETPTDPKLRFRMAESAGDIRGAAEAAIDFMRNATPKNTTVDDVLRFLRVYHNSPHLLKKADGTFADPETGERLGFDHRFMGSGEGAQAHGWGSYFSVKDLAGYASTYDPSVYQGMRITQNDEYVISNGGNAKTSELLFETVYGLCKSCETAPDEDAIKRYVIETITSRFQEHQQEANRQRRLLDALKDNEPWAVTVTNAQTGDIITDPKTGYRYSEEDSSVDYVRWRYEISKKMEGRYGKVLSFIESNPDYVEHFVAKVERHKYAVEIPDPDTNHYIREDRRLTKHEEEMIRKAINDKWELRDSVLEKRSWRGITGKEAYKDLSLVLGAKQASLLLNEAGFVGIHYNGHIDGECYVIFNEKDAKITDHIRFRRTSNAERLEVERKAKADGSWLLAPDGTPTTLSEDGWIASRSSDFKAEYGDWRNPEVRERSRRIEKLLKSDPIVIPQEGVIDLSLRDRKEIRQWAKENLKRSYTNRDTGDAITISTRGIKEASHHGMNDNAHKMTFAYIPQMIENSIFLYEDHRQHKGAPYAMYRYYVAGMNINGEDYTVRLSVGVDENGRRYYDHGLTQIEKKKLVDFVNQPAKSFTAIEGMPEAAPQLSSAQGKGTKSSVSDKQMPVTHEGQPAESFISMGAEPSVVPDPSVAPLKDKRLVEILQGYLPESFYQANGEPKREIVEEYLRTEEEKEVRYRRVKADPMNAISPINPQWDGEWYSPEDLTGKSTADLLELPAAPATPEKRPTQSVASYAETMSRHYADPRVRFRTGAHTENLRAPQPPRITDGMSLYEVAQLQHEYNRNYRDFSEESMRRMGALDKLPEKFIRSQIDVARPVELFVEEMKRLGMEVSPEDNMYWSLMLQSSKELNMKKREVEPMFERYAETIREMNLDGSLEKVPSVSYVYMKDPNVKKSKSVVKDANGYEKASLYLQAKDIDECKKLGLPYRGEKGFEDLVTNKETGKKISPEEYISLFENAVGKARAEGLCDQIRAISNWSTQKLYEAGLLTEDRYRELTRGSRRYYVPQRGFKITEETDRRAYELAELKAEGRQSLSADPVANLQAICNTTVIRAIRNRDLLDFYRWCKKNEQELYHRGVLEMGESYYRRTDEVDDKGRRVYLQSKKAPTLEEMRADNQTRREMAKIRMEKAALREKADRGLISSYTFEAKTKELDDRLKTKEDELIVKYRDPNLSLGDTDKTAKKDERVVRVYENGEERIIALSEDYSGKAVADALNNRSIGRYIDSDNIIAKGFRALGTITRTLSSLRTQYNPAFAVKNASRDMKAAVAANMGDFGWAYTQQFLRNVPKVQRAVWEYVWKENFWDAEDLKSGYGQYMKEFFEDGAATGYSFLEPFNILHKNLKGIAEPTTWNNIVHGRKGLKSLYATMRLWAVLSEGSELSTRFAEYVTSRERGFSRKEAAIHAKEVTVNFNRHGAISPYLNTLFGFWNASVQGAYRWYRIPLRFMAKVSAQLFIAGMLQAYLYLRDDDDKDYTEWDLMTNLCIGDLRVPLPQNLRGFNGAGLQFMLACMGKKDWQAAVIDAGQFMAGEYLPSEAASLLNAVQWDETRGTLKDGGAQVWRDIAPTAISPMADVIANRNFMGQPVYKMPYVRSQDDNVAHWSLGKKRTKQVYKDFAEWQWKMRGGSTERNDLMSRNGTSQLSNSKLNNPSVIEHLVEGYGGGPISGLADIGTWIEFASTGDVKELKKLQMIAPFFRQERDYTATDVKYWELTDLYRSRQQTMSNLRKAKEGEDLERYREMTKRVSELAPRMTGEQLTEKIWEDGTQDEKLYVTWLETKALLKQIDKGTVTKEEVAPTIDRLTEQFRELR